MIDLFIYFASFYFDNAQAAQIAGEFGPHLSNLWYSCHGLGWIGLTAPFMTSSSLFNISGSVHSCLFDLFHSPWVYHLQMFCRVDPGLLFDTHSHHSLHSQQIKPSAGVRLVYSVSVDPFPALCQNPSFYVTCSPSHRVRRPGALIFFHHPYAHTLSVPQHCCKVHLIGTLLCSITILPGSSTKKPDTHPPLPSPCLLLLFFMHTFFSPLPLSSAL